MRKRKIGSYVAASVCLSMAMAAAGEPVSAATITPSSSAEQQTSVLSAQLINPTTVEVNYSDGVRTTIDFYGSNIFRMFRDVKGGIVRNPKAMPPAQILVDNPRKDVGGVSVNDSNGTITIATRNISVTINKASGLIKVTNLATGAVVMEETSPAVFEKGSVKMTLKENENEYFFGGGVQNGRFSHKGKSIKIVNTNNWTDGGVASPTPYYWSTAGYGIMWHTFRPGEYDFGSKKKGTVTLSHDSDYLDVFVMVNDGAVALLNDFYQLTGNPVLLPKFGFYEGHLNAYNRDYWKEVEKGGVLFEDGKYYREEQKDNGGTKESLNGEKNNYQFSARAVIDRYNAYDMPLGWILPNDGYGAGYGQTSTLDGNVQNLKEFGDYARKNGVEIGLWTQSDLHPKEGIEPLLQRDIVKEVRDAGVRVLKTDVAWVGAGYSFGLNGVADVGEIMPYYGNDARPFIISLDGWAGTQRYAGIWSGDQTGGDWEYIRFHIPTYIGSGLSGQPNISSDMDGIFGGKNVPVNVRDFQWKTFTPMQLNMDGWGSNPKYPHILGEPATSINRWYLKMKSELMPYAYSIAHEAIDGKPIIRAMMLDYPNAYTLGKSTQYQFLFGPSILVAPIYQATAMDADGNDVRNGIYLPEGEWVDYFTGNVYKGGRIINNFDAPLWKLPIFIKRGAIIPLNNAHNNPNQVDKNLRIYEIYPYGESEFTEYDDDGKTQAYLYGESATTQIKSILNAKGVVTVTITPTKGAFKGFEKMKATELCINASAAPKKVTAKVGGKKVTLRQVNSLDELYSGGNAYYYAESPNLNRYATAGTDFAKKEITKNPVIYVRLAEANVSEVATTVTVEGYKFNAEEVALVSTGALAAPTAEVKDVMSTTLTPSWAKVDGADYYEIEYDGMLYSTISNTELLFEGLTPETEYSFKVRAVNKDGVSDWASVSAKTAADPLQFAIKGIRGTTSCPNQGGQGIDKLFDFDETTTWHTAWSGKAVPFEMIVDLRCVAELDKMQYVPRGDAGNGVLLNGSIAYSTDKSTWTEAGEFKWAQSGTVKEFTFDGNPTVRYIKINVTKAVGNFGSGCELYVFKTPGSESYIPGDINHDGKIDENDLTSYMNYTGLRAGDGDYEGYISKGDINANGLIDAYDIMTVALELDGGVSPRPVPAVQGNISLKANKNSYAAGEDVEITVSGEGLVSVNALSFALPYDATEFEFVGIDAVGMKQMNNLTYDRLHTNGTKALYPTFVNLGEKPYLEDGHLFTIKMKAKKRVKFALKAIDGMILDKAHNTVKF